MNADGSGLTRLVTEAYIMSWPTWSPDGRKIAFVSHSHASGNAAIQVLDVDGSGLRKIAADGFHPSWSPGGRKIAYNTGTLDTDIGDILVMNPDGSHKVVAASYGTPTAYEMPTWSPDGEPPDGRRIVFSGVRLLDLRRQRTAFLHSGSHPRWSPDGRRIVFADNGQIFVMNADGSNVGQLTQY